MADLTAEDAPQKPWLAWTRLAVGLAQGLAGYALYENWKELDPVALGALALAVGGVPVIALGAIGALRTRTLILWLVAAAAVAAALGGYHRFLDQSESEEATLLVAAFTGAALFIAHHLILPADQARRWIAPYDRYFDEGWKTGVRLALAIGFTGAMWILLLLASALFTLIKIKAVENLIQEPWFFYPATTTFFALGVHLTDVRAGLVRGARTLALSLLSWLLPLMTLIGAAFLATLPFTGLKPLWDTGTATPILLAAAAALIMLINAAYQDGEKPGFPPRLLKWAGRLAAVLIAPLAGIAAYGVMLRIGQYGLTPARFYAMAAIVVGACYAAGYLWATVSKGPWLKRLEATNIAAAHLAVVVILLITSPLISPTRLSVESQVRRLETGKVTAGDFDYAFLRFEAGAAGRKALDELAKGKTGKEPAVVAQKAKDAIAAKNRYVQEIPPRQVAADAYSLVGKTPIPADFLAQLWTSEDRPSSACGPRDACPVMVTDLTGDAVDEVVVFGRFGTTLVYGRAQAGSPWARIGALEGSACGDVQDADKAGKIVLAPRLPGQDVIVNGHRLAFQPRIACEARAVIIDTDPRGMDNISDNIP